MKKLMRIALVSLLLLFVLAITPFYNGAVTGLFAAEKAGESIILIGTNPPCPRCGEMYELVKKYAKQKGTNVCVKKLTWSTPEALHYGPVVTAHEIATWANIPIDWKKVGELAWQKNACGDIEAKPWVQELDDILMPLKKKADEMNWVMTPALYINGKLVHHGYRASEDQIKAYILK